MIELVGDSSRGGEWALARLAVEDGVVVSADVPGLARPLEGLTLLEAAAVPGERLAADALANAIGPIVSAPPDASRVAVAMSGGVDSAVALLRAGADAVGVTLRLWIDPAGPAAERVCCSPDAVIAARETCHRLGLPHVTLDLREEFRDAVVRPFVDAYGRGETPNPCVACNGSFRFDELLAFADRIGAARLATGHYARIVEHGSSRLLARAHDEAKDQSYMLARLAPAKLERVWFPLGDQTKADTRAEAARAGLAAAGRAESQEACFLGGGDYRAFLAAQGLGGDGEVVDERGTVLGRHDGLWRFTPGQRRGLGVASTEPLYALRGDRATGTLVVGPRASLAVRTVEVRGDLFVPTARAEAKLRSRSPAVAASVSASTEGFRLALERDAFAVAPGQAAVLYDDGVVVGSGLITSAGP